MSAIDATCPMPIETYTYDAAGNRTSAAGRTFTYDAQGQLATCTPTCGTPAFDPEGRLTGITTASGAWTCQYDAEWVSELPGGSRGAREVFQSLTGRLPDGGYTSWRSYRGYLEVVYRPTSKSGGPAVEIINHVTMTIEKIRFVVGGGR